MFLTDLLFEGFQHYFAAFFDGDMVGSADWAGNKLVFSDCVEFKVLVALWAMEQYRCYDCVFHCFSSLSVMVYSMQIKRVIVVFEDYIETAYLYLTISNT